jgi:hypothetical protein
MSSSTTRRLVVGSVASLAVVAAAASAFAAPRTSAHTSFFSGGAGSAGWVTTQAEDGDGFSAQLNVPDSSSYAGIDLHPAAALPSSEPSFWVAQTGTVSGGSPRLVIASADGCYATEYVVDQASDGSWQQANQWDLAGSCGYAYNAGYTGVETAFAGRAVSDAYVVDDTYQSAGHTSWIDNISYGDATLSKPSDNARH